MASAKQSELDKLHAMYTKELLRQLKEERTDENGERVAPSASLLAVIGKFLLSSGVKPTSDNPSIAELSKLKGKAVDVKEIGKDLGVRYALEGSVRRVGDAITVNAQLISTETGAHVWADRFEGERTKLGQLQVEVVARLANSLGVELTRAEALRGMRERPNNPDAVDLAMRGLVALLRFGPAGNKEAKDYFERALELDPKLVRGQIGLSFALSDGVVFGWSVDPPADAQRADKLADEALAALPNDAAVHMAKALAYQDLNAANLSTAREQNWKAGIAEADEALDIDPNNAGAHAVSGYWRLFLGRAEEGFAGVETAIKLSPRDPVRSLWEFQLCHLHSHLAQWEQAVDRCQRAIQGFPSLWYAHADLAAANAWLGRAAEAKAAVAELLRLRPDQTAQGYLSTARTYSNNAVFLEQIARMVEGMRKAGLPEGETKTN